MFNAAAQPLPILPEDEAQASPALDGLPGFGQLLASLYGSLDDSTFLASTAYVPTIADLNYAFWVYSREGAEHAAAAISFELQRLGGGDGCLAIEGNRAGLWQLH